mgnify:CR=1 FL=1
MTEKGNDIESQFQSTLLQEERHSTPLEARKLYNFNPRSYKRSDLIGETYAYVMGDFNPRSYKRSDIVENLKCYILTLFQSTLLQEERHPRNRYCFCL